MTPFGHKIETELDNEANRMANEWFFVWHRLSYGEVVDVDDFCGKRIMIGGVTFWEAPSLYIGKHCDVTFSIRLILYLDAQRMKYAAHRPLMPQLSPMTAPKLSEYFAGESSLKLSRLIED